MDDTIFKPRKGLGFGEGVEALLDRLRGGRGALRAGALVGAMGVAAAGGLAGCEGEASDPEPQVQGDPSAPGVPSPGVDKADWAQAEGERNTEMVAYTGEYFTEYAVCYERFCNSVDTILKVFVKPTPGANIDSKRVGIVAGRPGYEGSATFLGTYFSTHPDGLEEWQVRVGGRSSSWGGYFPLFLFTAWYQDGTGKTYYDDNQGEFHPVCAQNRYSVLSQVWCCSDELTNVRIDDSGVTGKIRLLLSDLDYDKDLRLVWTTDAWATVNEYAIGEGNEANAWRWVQDAWNGQEYWEINLAIPGDFQTFEYAIVYRHGVVNDARPYEFWDNNGGRNYVVTRVNPEDSPTNPAE